MKRMMLVGLVGALAVPAPSWADGGRKDKTNLAHWSIVGQCKSRENPSRREWRVRLTYVSFPEQFDDVCSTALGKALLESDLDTVEVTASVTPSGYSLCQVGSFLKGRRLPKGGCALEPGPVDVQLLGGGGRKCMFECRDTNEEAWRY